MSLRNVSPIVLYAYFVAHKTMIRKNKIITIKLEKKSKFYYCFVFHVIALIIVEIITKQFFYFLTVQYLLLSNDELCKI